MLEVRRDDPREMLTLEDGHQGRVDWTFQAADDLVRDPVDFMRAGLMDRRDGGVIVLRMTRKLYSPAVECSEEEFVDFMAMWKEFRGMEQEEN